MAVDKPDFCTDTVSALFPSWVQRADDKPRIATTSFTILP